MAISKGYYEVISLLYVEEIRLHFSNYVCFIRWHYSSSQSGKRYQYYCSWIINVFKKEGTGKTCLLLVLRKSVQQAICVITENLAGYMFQLIKLVVGWKYVRLRFTKFLALSLMELHKLLIFRKVAQNVKIAVINHDINTLCRTSLLSFNCLQSSIILLPWQISRFPSKTSARMTSEWLICNFCLSFVIFLILMAKDRQTWHLYDNSQTKVRNSLILILVCLSEFRVYK